MGRSPTEDEETQALQDWEDLHIQPPLEQTAPTNLSKRITDLLNELGELVQTRPVGLLRELRRIERHTGRLLITAVAEAHARHLTWAEIGTELGMTRQSAHQRFSSKI